VVNIFAALQNTNPVHTSVTYTRVSQGAPPPEVETLFCGEATGTRGARENLRQGINKCDFVSIYALIKTRKWKSSSVEQPQGRVGPGKIFKA